MGVSRALGAGIFVPVPFQDEMPTPVRSTTVIFDVQEEVCEMVTSLMAPRTQITGPLGKQVAV